MCLSRVVSLHIFGVPTHLKAEKNKNQKMMWSFGKISGILRLEIMRAYSKGKKQIRGRKKGKKLEGDHHSWRLPCSNPTSQPVLG